MNDKIKTEADAREIILAEVTDLKFGTVETYTTRPDIMEGYATPWYKDRYEVKVIKSYGKLWPEGATVEQTSYSYRNCYATADYLVRSPKELTEQDFETLRDQGCFMHGQETGRVRGHKVVDGVHVYSVSSVCDSGD